MFQLAWNSSGVHLLSSTTARGVPFTPTSFLAWMINYTILTVLTASPSHHSSALTTLLITHLIVSIQLFYREKVKYLVNVTVSASASFLKPILALLTLKK